MTLGISIISVAVDNLDRAIAFYRDGLGWPCWSHPVGVAPVEPCDEVQDHAVFEMQNGLSFVLYERESLARDAEETATERGTTDFILNIGAQTEKEVEVLLNSAVKNGAKKVGNISKHSWGTTAKFRDLDGHLWEIMWSAG